MCEFDPDVRYVSGDRRIRHYRDMCDQIAASVKRHVDDVSDATVVPEVENVCEYCGYPWTENTNDYNGGCCDKDQENEP